STTKTHENEKAADAAAPANRRQRRGGYHSVGWGEGSESVYLPPGEKPAAPSGMSKSASSVRIVFSGCRPRSVSAASVAMRRHSLAGRSGRARRTRQYHSAKRLVGRPTPCRLTHSRSSSTAAADASHGRAP